MATVVDCLATFGEAHAGQKRLEIEWRVVATVGWPRPAAMAGDSGDGRAAGAGGAGAAHGGFDEVDPRVGVVVAMHVTGACRPPCRLAVVVEELLERERETACRNRPLAAARVVRRREAQPLGTCSARSRIATRCGTA